MIFFNCNTAKDRITVMDVVRNDEIYYQLDYFVQFKYEDKQQQIVYNIINIIVYAPTSYNERYVKLGQTYSEYLTRINKLHNNIV